MVPWEAASKQAKSGMIWPPGKTSIRNRPPLVSSTILANRSAAPSITSSRRGQDVDMRHWTFGWAMTLGTSATAAVATAATVPAALVMNLRRAVITAPLHGHELMVGALGDVVPGADQRLELRVGGVHLPGHGALLRFFLDDLGGQLLQITQHRRRELKHLDFSLEL